MRNYQKYFVENELYINNRKFKYFLSPILLKNNFKHGFFTKTSSEVNLSLLTNCQNQNQNFILKQIHSNKIIFCSNALLESRPEADGIFAIEVNEIYGFILLIVCQFYLLIKLKDLLQLFIAEKRFRK